MPPRNKKYDHVKSKINFGGAPAPARKRKAAEATRPEDEEKTGIPKPGDAARRTSSRVRSRTLSAKRPETTKVAKAEPADGEPVKKKRPPKWDIKGRLEFAEEQREKLRQAHGETAQRAGKAEATLKKLEEQLVTTKEKLGDAEVLLRERESDALELQQKAER